MRRPFILLISLCLWGHPAFVGADDAAQDLPLHLQQVLASLKSQSFASRRAAVETFSKLPMSDVESIATLSDDQLTPEVCVQLMKQLERHYTSVNLPDRIQTSEILEALTESDRLMLADGAQNLLRTHWRIRVTLARQALEDMGAQLREGSFSHGQMMWFAGTEMPTFQILLNESWKGGHEGLRQIQRMSVLVGPEVGARGVFVWVLVGHPLTDKDFSLLYEIVGPARVNERSQVALGIQGQQGVGQGVVIRIVSRKGSAETAGLRAGDRLLSIREEIPDSLSLEEKKLRLEAQQLVDFDDLVERLKNYRPGDVIRIITMRAITNEIEEVPVRLKGWTELPVHPN